MYGVLLDSSILIVDDVENNLDVLDIIFSRVGARSIRASSGEEALEITGIKGREIDLVITDVSMPGMSGITLTSILRETLGMEIPIIILTANAKNDAQLSEGLAAGANDYLHKPVNEVELLARSASMVRLKRAFDDNATLQKSLELKVIERTVEVEIIRDASMFGFAKLAELRDPETGGHLERIAEYTKAIAKYLEKNGSYQEQVDQPFIRDIHRASPLHDIGKVGIPDNVLLKPGKLTPDEFEIMKRHAFIGGRTLNEAETRLLTSNSFISMAKEIAFCHHEKWDGSGYPGGIKGESIPLAARIMAVADVYDALISKRVYKDAFSEETTRSIIVKSSGTHFDPAIVEAFVAVKNEFSRIRATFQES
ncbi:MAG: response regulator [Nitrospinae bacterium]|nr:response regulator [Nitrospinota bacterium]